MEDKRINIIVDKDFKRQVKVKATQEGKTLTEVILTLLKKWLKKIK